jgi:hypothetical protein
MASKRFKKIIRTIHKYEGRVLKVAAPVAGAIFLGPVGAAAGTAVGSAASYYGEKQGALAKGRKGAQVKKAGRRGLKSGLIIGGAITGGAAILSIAGGVGAATSSASALGNIFGSHPKPAGGVQPQYGDYGQDSNGFVTQNGLNQSLGGGSPGSSGASGFNWGSLTNASRSIGATGATTGDRDFGQIGALLNSNIAGVPLPLILGGLVVLAVL